MGRTEEKSVAKLLTCTSFSPSVQIITFQGMCQMALCIGFVALLYKGFCCSPAGILLLNLSMRNINLFENKQIRTVWNGTDEKWYFVVEDVVAVLIESTDPKLKN